VSGRAILDVNSDGSETNGVILLAGTVPLIDGSSPRYFLGFYLHREVMFECARILLLFVDQQMALGFCVAALGVLTRVYMEEALQIYQLKRVRSSNVMATWMTSYASLTRC